MARPQRNNVDYFPFYCDEGNKMFYIEETYGNDGFAVFIKLLRELAKTDYHYLDLSKNTTSMFLSAKCKVDVNKLESIINDLAELGKFDSELWIENRIIWCDDFVNSVKDAYSKRSNSCIDKNSLITILQSKGILKQVKLPRKPLKSSSDSSVKPQSILEYSKEKENKEDNIKELTEKFLNWFNIKKEIHTGSKGRAKSLTDIDVKNLKKLKENYSIEDFDIAISFMFKNKWAKENNMFTPAHFLRNDNFNKYFQSEETNETNGYNPNTSDTPKKLASWGKKTI